MKKNLTMQLLPLWLLAFFFFASVPIKAQTHSEATPRVGIIKMIGCGTGTEANKAQIQVIHDGTGYSYNFGANASAQSGSTAWLPAGTHTVTVTKGSRTYKLPITVPAKVAPTFTPTITYNCNGTADVRLTNNQGTYNYTYTYGGNTHNSPYFRDLAVGQHTITVKYTQPTSERDIVFFDDFGTKETGDPRAVRSKYAISTMNFAPLDGTQRFPNGTVLTGKNLTNDACYTVATKADADTENISTTWLYPNDKDGKANGRYLYYDAATINQNLYTRKAKVKPNTPVNFSAYLFNTVKTTYSSGVGATYTVRVTLDIYANESAAQAGTTPLFRSYYFNVPAATTDANKWYPINVTANIEGGYSELVFVVRMYGDSLNGGIGNDIALDNVLVTQPTAICEQTLTVPVSVVTNTNTYSTTVTYNCAANNATIKVTPSVTAGYTYTYKLDNGTAGSNNTFNNVGVGVHTLTLTSQYTGAKVIFKEDFGSGAPYRLPETVVPKPFVCKDVLYGYPADILPEGHYQVANVNNLTQMNSWNWRSPKDHTNSTDGQGRYLAFNHGANANKPFYKQDIRVEDNKPVTVEYYAYNINQNSTVDLPKIKVKLVNKATNAVVHTSSPFTVTGNASDTDWRKVTFTFTPPVNARDLELNFINEENSEGSNDFAIDDILVTQAYEVCATTVTATVAPKVTQAFAGVTRLIGCGTGANANKAEVTITNVQGGTGAYEYNFDGTWVATNTGWLPAGTHTVSVRAKGTGNSCQYDMSVTVLAAIAQPTIKTEVFYACDGKAILNVGVENPDPELTYMYSLDGGAYTTTYVYTNVASGTHSISVQYEHRSVPSPSLLFREDFGNGNPTPLPGPASDYGLTYGTTYPIGAGFYQIVSQADAPSYWALLTPFNTCAVRSGNLSDRWVSVYDHTSGGTDATGRFYMSDFRGTQADGDLFYKREVNVLPGADINYEFYALNLFRQDRTTSPWSPNPEALKPNVVVRLVAPDGTVVASTTTGEIPNSVCATNLADNLKNWRKYEGKLNVGTYTKLTVEIRSAGSALHGWGNDMALDDITVNMIPKSCGQVISATKVVTANAHDIPAFTVSKTYDCATGKGVLTVTPTATTGFTYTYTLGSTTYTSTTATFTGLDLEQTYTVSVSYQAVSNTITLLNEDFGAGTDPVKSPYVGKNLYFNKNTNAAYTTYNANGQSRAHAAGTFLKEEEYCIADHIAIRSYDWDNPSDHTGKTNGRMLYINGISAVPTQEVYTRQVNILPNLPLTFTTSFYNLIRNVLVVSPKTPRVNIALYENEATYRANANNFIAQTPILEIPSTNNKWETQTITLTAAQVANRTSMYAVVRMHNVLSEGHDLAIDDIVITQKLPACTTSVTTTLTKGDVATPTLTLPANLSVICSAPTASATISSWIASATATSTCGTATVTHNYSYPSNLCNVGGAVTVTFSTTDPFGNVVSGTRVITFATMTLTVTPTTLSVPNGALGGTTSSVVPNITLGGVASPSTNSVTITFSGLPTGVTSTTGGRLIVAPNTPAGTHTITYRVCETANNNNCKTVTTTLVIGTGSLTVTPVTPLTVPNGISGGTTSSVLTGITLNGTTVTNTNSVTISFSGLPAGVTTDTQGRIVVPTGTPATSTLVTYKVCEKLNPTNCQTVTSTLVIGTGSLTVTPVTPLTIPNGITGGTTSSVLTGVRLNGNVVTNTNSVTISFSGLPAGVTTDTQGRIVVPAGTPATSTLVTYKVCEKLNLTNCQTVTSTLVIGTGSLTVTPVTPLTVPNGISGGTTSSVLTGITLNGATVTNTNSVTISFSGLPTGVTTNTNGQLVIPAGTPAGTHTITYRVCEKLNPTNCQTVTSTLVIGTGSLTVTPVTPLTVPNGITGGTTSSVLTGVRLNGNVVTNTNSVTITFSGLPAGVTTDTQGRIVIPAGTPATSTLVTYKVCEKLNPTNCQTVTSTLVIGTGSLTVTPVTPLTVPNGIIGGTTSSVLTGVRLNGNVVTNTNSVTISFSGLPAGVTTDTQGHIVVPAGTPATSTLVTYRVCEKLNPTNCKTVTSTLVIGTGSLTVTPVTPLTIPNGIIGGTTSSVLTGVRLNGNVVTNTNSVTISFSGLPAGVTTDTQGRIVVPAGTPATSTLVTYRVCEKLNPTNCQTVTSTLVIGTGSLTVTPVTPLTVPNGISGGTTSSVLTGVRLNGNVVTNTNSVTITFSGLPAGVTTDTQGRIVIPAGTPATNTLVTYKVCEKLNPTNCQTVTSTLVIGTGSLTVTPVTPLTVPNGISGGTTSSVLTGVRLNGNVVTNTNSVTITFSGLPAGVTTDTQGRIVIPAGTPATSTLVTYKVCEKLNPTNCQTVTSTLVIGTGSLTVTSTTLTHPNGTQGGTTTGTVLSGVKINGNPVNTASVTITWNSLPPNATGNASGTVTIAPNTPAGTYTISYTVCERLNGNSNCQSVTSQITIGGGSLTATPTNLTHPNGTQGGTTTGTVLTGVKINGNPVNTASVTITWNSLPPNATGNASGTVTIAPNTPAGTYTISYTVCERLNGNSNCQSVTSQITIGGGSLTATPTNLTHPNGTQGGTTTGTVLTGVKINGNPVNTASVTITWNTLPPNATGNASGTVTIAPNTPAGTYTISYTVCERLNGNSNCQSVTSQITIGGGTMTVTPTTLTHPNGTQGGTTTGTVLTGVKINGNPVNTASVTITWNTLPPNATGNASGTVTIAPNTPAGTYTISYTVCERLNGNSNCQSVTSQITIGGGNMTVTPTTLTHPNGTQGGTTTGTVLTGVKINGNPVNTASVTITWNTLPPNATGNASGTVTIAPNTPAGTYTISYTVCERLNGNSNCQSVTSQITIGGGSLTVTPTQLIVANGATGGTSVNNVLTGVKINGNPVNTNSVTITWNSLPPGFTGTNSGTVTVPANTPAGTYTVSYTVCERLNQNNNCKTVTSTIIVGNGNMLVVPTPITVPNGTIGGTSTPSVLTGVVLNGNSNPAPNTVSITWHTLPPRATGNNDGTVNVAPNTPAGTYTVSYTICEALNSGHCTTVTSTITIGGGVLTVTPVTTLTVANGAQGGTTTSSVLTGVSLNGQPANSQSVTITFTGLPAGVTSNTNGQLVVAPGTPATNTTIYYTVCETLNANNNCHTYSTTLVIGTPNLSVTPRTYTIPDATVGGTTSSVLETVTIDGHTPSSQSVTITFGNLPVGIQTTTSGGFRVPAGTPTGIHTVTYTVCEVLNPDHCVTSIATIAVGNVPVVTPNAFTYTGTATVTTPSILDDDTVGTQSATTGTGGNVVINITSTPTGTVVPSLDANNGRVTIPAGTPPGIYTITYDVCTTATPTACTPGAVVITIPNVPVITPDDMVYTDTTTTTAGNILTNDRVGTQSATAGNGGNVSITVTIPATPKAPGATVPTLNPNTGVVTVPAGTPSGTYTITYKICTTATPTSCDTGVVTITVSGTVTDAPDTNDVTAYTRINTPVTVGVTSSTTVTVSIPSQPANGTAVSNGDGTITYTPNNGFKGTDSFEYSLCNAAGCRTATISVRVTSELIIYNGVSIGGSDKNNHFHIEGIENYPNNTVRIYNRWGVKVFEMSGYNNTTKAFRGVSDARATLEASDNLPQGTYYYIIEYVDEHNKTQTETGWLYLKKN